VKGFEEAAIMRLWCLAQRATMVDCDETEGLIHAN